MYVPTVLAALVATLATYAAAAPTKAISDNMLPGVLYMDHVEFTEDADVLKRGMRMNGDNSTGAPAGGILKFASAKDLKYYGGPVINNVEVTMLLWGSGVAFSSDLPAFYAGVTNSPYMDILKQYTAGGAMGRGTYKGSLTLTGFPTSKTVTNAQIRTYLRSLVSAGTLKPNKNSYYPIHFPSGITIDLDGDKSCSTFCAFHNTVDISDLGSKTVKYLYYGVMPDQGGSCAGGCGSSSSTFKNLCSVSSHELIEAITDPAVGLATTFAAPLAWYNEANGEIADICNAQQATTVGGDGVTYTIQKEWSNAAGKCVAA